MTTSNLLVCGSTSRQIQKRLAWQSAVCAKCGDAVWLSEAGQSVISESPKTTIYCDICGLSEVRAARYSAKVRAARRAN